MIEIMICGKGGQGAVMAAKLLADAAIKGGFNAQSFSAYGAERRGGKVESFIRIGRSRIRVHSKMYQPDYLVIMDDGIKALPAVKPGAKVLINTRRAAGDFNFPESVTVTTLDAGTIAAKNEVLLPSGMPVINTTLTGALVALLDGIDVKHLYWAILQGKLPQAEKNIHAAQAAYTLLHDRTNDRPSVSADNGPAPAQIRYPGHRLKTPPCEFECRTGHLIHETLALVRDNCFEEALANIRTENPFPGTCGRVCSHPCESVCHAARFDQAPAINSLERAVFDCADHQTVPAPSPKAPSGKKIAVIGSGPAGLTGAYFAALLGHAVTVFEALPEVGGIPRIGIPAYRLPKGVVAQEVAHIASLGVVFKTGIRLGTDIAFETIRAEFDACFIATGAHCSLKLNLPGEKNLPILGGLSFLKDVALEKPIAVRSQTGLNDLDVVVVGGGNTAVDAARSALRLGARRVTILYRRSREQMPAYGEEIEAALAEGVKIRFLTIPVQIQPAEGQAGSLVCMATALEPTAASASAADAPPVPRVVPHSETTMAVDVIISAIGEEPDVSFLGTEIATRGSLIKCDSLGRTSLPGVFAGGDISSLTRDVPAAIAAGKRAALGLDLYLRGSDDQQMADALAQSNSGAVSMRRYMAGTAAGATPAPVAWNDLNLCGFTAIRGALPNQSPLHKSVSDFRELKKGLSKTAAVEEAGRCFHCGDCNACGRCYLYCPDGAIKWESNPKGLNFDAELCKSCGICIRECPRDAIAWQETEKSAEGTDQ